MPTKPARMCPKCGNRVTGRCPCTKQRTENRKNATERGYTYRWRVLRTKWLELHPMCQGCQVSGYDTAAVLVDHIVRHQEDQRLFWDQRNWQGLCRECHDIKTSLELGKTRRPPMPNRWIVCGEPGAGKTTYVEQQRKRLGDKCHVYDMDERCALYGITARFPLPHNEHMTMIIDRGIWLSRFLFDESTDNVYTITTNRASAELHAGMIGARVYEVRRCTKSRGGT